MADYLWRELLAAIIVVGYGGLLSFIYDIIRNIRFFIKHNFIVMSIEDMLFWFATGIATIRILIKINDGGLRIYFLMGMLLGGYIYMKTIHFLLKKICSLITIRYRKRGGKSEKRRKKI